MHLSDFISENLESTGANCTRISRWTFESEEDSSTGRASILRSLSAFTTSVDIQPSE